MTDEYTAPDYQHAALLTIDVQHSTLEGGSLEILGTRDAASRIKGVAALFRESRWPIVHVVRLYEADGSNAELCRRRALERGAEFFLAGTTGSALAEELLPRTGIGLEDRSLLAGSFQQIGPLEWVMYKPRWSAFFATGLEGHLRSYGVTTVVVSGCNYPNCPRATLYDASARDFRSVLISDAVSRFDDRGQHEMNDIGVFVVDAAAFVARARCLES
jgi:nicotinamidase-related amidase